MNKLLEIKDLNKTYYSTIGEVNAIDSFNLIVNKEDFISIVGPSGCGKSTILNIISNIDKDYKGKVIMDDNIKVSYMLQKDTLFPWLTVLDNCLLPLKIKKEVTKENIDYVTSLLIKYGLKEFINKYPSELSGGMKQRVA